MTTQLTGRVLTPSDSGFEQASKNFNERITRNPKVVVFCQNQQDVQNAVLYAREHQLPVSVRCGRHNYENFSLVDDGVVIDVSDMTTMHIDASKDTVDIGSGTQLIEIYTKVTQQGYGFPGGLCPTVGISGLTLGGGIGLLTRHLGMTCDSLLELEMVNAQGEVLIANEKENSDLFWACRGGGGGNLGVVTRFRFKLHKIGDVSIFQATWDWDKMAEAIDAWQRWGTQLDPRFTAIIMLHGPQHADPGAAIASGLLVGSEEELHTMLEPLLKVKPKELKVVSKPYYEAIKFFAGDPAPDWTAYWHGQHRKFKNTSAMAYELLSEEAIQKIVKHLEKAPAPDNLLQFETLGGAVSKLAPEDTAFPHRQALFSLQYQAYWSEDDVEQQHLDWINAFRKDMLPHTVGAFMNYPDLAIKDWEESYYGPNVQRLREVKAKYDPENFFKFDQSIRPAKQAQLK